MDQNLSSKLLKHLKFIQDFIAFLLDKEIEIVQYKYDGKYFGSWLLDIYYNKQLRRFAYDGRDASLLVVDSNTGSREFPSLEQSKQIFYKLLSEKDIENILDLVINVQSK